MSIMSLTITYTFCLEKETRPSNDNVKTELLSQTDACGEDFIAAGLISVY